MSIVVVVDANEGTRQRTARTLRMADFQVVEAVDGIEALRCTFATRPDAAVVDVDAPGIDGYELVRVFRAACDVPVIAVVHAATPEQVVRALEAGADDAIDPACSAVELVARTRAAMRRHDRRMAHVNGDARQVATGNLVIDRTAQTVTKGGRRLQLTRTEHRLLDALASRAGEVAQRRFLLSAVWGEECVEDTQYLRVYIGYLRAKIEDDPSRPRYIVNEWGTGYRLQLLPIEVDDEFKVLATA